MPILAFPDPDKPYTLYTDASDYCVGAYSHRIQGRGGINIKHLTKLQKWWPVGLVEKEAYAIVYALQKIDTYLHGAEFTIETDHI